MISKKRLMIAGIVALLVLMAVLAFGFPQGGKKPEKIWQVACIYRSILSEDSQQAIRLGFEQAAREYNVDITMLPMNSSQGAVDQVDAVENEIRKGADAIVIEPQNDVRVWECLEEAEKKIPVIRLNAGESSGADQKGVQIGIDSGLLWELGEKIRTLTGPGEMVIIAEPDIAYQDVKEAGDIVTGILEAADVNVQRIQVSGGKKERELTYASLMRGSSLRHLVVFGAEELETAAKLKGSEEGYGHVALYGLGSSRQVIAYLEDGVINVIGASNQYSVGYLGVSSAVESLRGIPVESSCGIEYKVLGQDEIYTKENQRLLFPFVQ